MNLRGVPFPAHPLLRAEALTLERGDVPLFGPLDFTLTSGDMLILEGANGVGKTSLLRVLAGLLPPTSGTLYWQDIPFARHDPVPGSIGMLGHTLGLKLDLTALENLRFRVLLANGDAAPAALLSALAQVGLEGYEDALVRTLSAGQRRRINLAALRCTACELWLLDEPYANLDLNGQQLLNAMLQRHCAQGGVAVLSHHGSLAAWPQAQVLRLRASQVVAA